MEQLDVGFRGIRQSPKLAENASGSVLVKNMYKIIVLE